MDGWREGGRVKGRREGEEGKIEGGREKEERDEKESN